MEPSVLLGTSGQGSSRLRGLVFGRTLRESKARLGYLFILPTLLYVAVSLFFTTGFTLVLTFFGWKVQTLGAFAGLTYYNATFADSIFWTTLRNTAVLAVISVPTTMIVALVSALALESSRRVPLRTLFRLIYFLPVVTSMVALAYIWKWLYNPNYGLINQVLRFIHVPPQLWLDSGVLVLPSLSLIYLWARFGFDMLIFIAGLEGISPEFYEAARIDGAGRWRSLLNITVPLLNPQFLLVGILETINAVNLFDLPYAATGGGPGDASRTAVMYIYDSAFTFFKFGQAAVSTLVLFLIVLALTLLQRMLVARQIDY